MTLGPVSIPDVRAFALAAVIALAGILLLLWRRRAFSPWTIGLLAMAMSLLALSAGQLEIQWPRAQRVAVLVDLSPSTRGAPWRDHAWLHRRLATLLPHAAYDTYAFADGALCPLPADVTEIAAGQTRLPPVSADAVVVFSDGQFVRPDHYARAFPVLTDWRPVDARVERLVYENQSAQATVSNDGPPRRLRWSASGQTATATVLNSITLRAPADLPVGPIEAHVDPADLWPENDAMALPPAPATTPQAWWVGPSPVPAGFRPIDASRLPRELSAFLPAGIIVLAGIGPDALPGDVQAMLGRYVSDLGGSLVLLTERSDYGLWRNSELVRVLPLSPDPPKPEMRWTVLLDNSGSMADAIGSRSRWQLATAAGEQMIAGLPADDVISIAAFSDSLRWVVPSSTVHDVLARPADLASQFPRGPTNLEPVLRQLAASAKPGEMTAILAITDAQVQLDDPAATLAALKAAGVRLSILALRDGPAGDVLRGLCKANGGVYLRQVDPARWTEAARQLGAAAAPSRLQHSRVTASVQAPFAPGTRTIDLWSRAWEKQDAQVLMSARLDREAVPLVARWQAGLGSAAVAVMPLELGDIQSLCEALKRRPADPRFQIDWSSANDGRLVVQAADAGHALNGLELSLSLSSLDRSAGTKIVPLGQTAPGRYAGSWTPLEMPAYAAVRSGGQVIASAALAGRYAPEFGRIGVNRPALEQLAQSTGGSTIGAGDSHPLRLPQPLELRPLAQVMSLMAALLTLVAAVLIRRIGS